MEQLISMRQRIKTVETIKKMTHAMRLIAMSTHSKLRNKKNNLDIYKNEFERIFSKVRTLLIKPKILQEESKQIKLNNLVILVGSQKGLCGTFNSTLFKFFENHYNINKAGRGSSGTSSEDLFITVGKHATDYLKAKKVPIFIKHNNFSMLNFVSVAQSVSDIIFKNFSSYSKIIIFSNYPKSFFVQEPKKYSFDITEFYKAETDIQVGQTEYIFEQSIEELTNTIIQFRLFIKVQDILFNSLVAEQSARFLSMDAATRNAENLLTTMRLEYNKLRQANITKELTELVTSY